MFILYIDTYTKDFKFVLQYSDDKNAFYEVDEELDTGPWATSLYRASLFHRSFYKFYWGNSTTWLICKCNICHKLVEINKSVYVIIFFALKIIIIYIILDA